MSRASPWKPGRVRASFYKSIVDGPGRAWLVILSNKKKWHHWYCCWLSILTLLSIVPHMEIYIFSWIIISFVSYHFFILENNVLNAFIEMCLMCKEKYKSVCIFKNMAFCLFLWTQVKLLLWLFFRLAFN